MLAGACAWCVTESSPLGTFVNFIWLSHGARLCLFIKVAVFIFGFAFTLCFSILAKHPRRKNSHLMVPHHAKDSTWHTKGGKLVFAATTYILSSGPALWPEPPPFLSCVFACFGSSHPPLPEERWEDPFGGFQQLAAGWWEAPQDSLETEQFAERGRLHRTLPRLHPGGFRARPPQSIFRPCPEPRVHWIENIPEEATGRNPQIILQGGKWASMVPGKKACDKETIPAHRCWSNAVFRVTCGITKHLLASPHPREMKSESEVLFFKNSYLIGSQNWELRYLMK